MIFILPVLLGYFLGAIPFGLLLTRAAGLGDIRAIGSGNIGATNVLRTGNKKLAAATLLLDAVKGVVAVLIARHVWGGDAALAAGAGAIIGHVFPVWLKFRGGKGVATALGTLLALAPWAGVAACAIWLTLAFTVKISSLSALVALALAPLLAFFLYHNAHLVFVCAGITILVFYTHRANIRRLLKGQEPKIGHKK